MEIIATRGDRTYLIKENNYFYLVNLDTKKASLADPPDLPDMFLKLGYWEPVDEVPDNIMAEILDVFRQHTD